MGLSRDTSLSKLKGPHVQRGWIRVAGNGFVTVTVIIVTVRNSSKRARRLLKAPENYLRGKLKGFQVQIGSVRVVCNGFVTAAVVELLVEKVTKRVRFYF